LTRFGVEFDDLALCASGRLRTRHAESPSAGKDAGVIFGIGVEFSLS
jgi:hypothetical protein